MTGALKYFNYLYQLQKPMLLVVMMISFPVLVRIIIVLDIRTVGMIPLELLHYLFVSSLVIFGPQLFDLNTDFLQSSLCA